MDFLKRLPVPEDAVQYKLFLLHPDTLDASEKQRRLLQVLENILAEVAPLLLGYIWQQQPFNLSYQPEKGDLPAHLGGCTMFGDNVEDEWFIVYLLKRVTHTFSDLAATIQDNDDQFLLIEAAEFLPEWLDPDSSENRVFIYHGELHILPNRSHPREAGWPLDSVPSVQEALGVLQTHGKSCMADKNIRTALDHRLQGYPGKLRTSLHHAHCYTPAGVAAVLSRRPDLVAPAVAAFYLRDPVDLQACRTFRNFPPESRVMTSVSFTRCLYAQLQQQSFVPDRRSGYTLPPQSHPQYKAHELGMKLAHGFEILCSKSGQATADTEAPVSVNPLWRGFLDSLKRNDYFKGKLEGSKPYRERMTAAESFFRQSVTNTESCKVHGPGEVVLQVLSSAPYSLEELKQQEAHLPPEDNDDWLNISPQELERLLEDRSGQRASTGPGVVSGVCPSQDEEKKLEEEANYTLVAVTRRTKKFINSISSHEGAEFQRSCSSDPFTFDPDAMSSSLDRLLGSNDELDSDDDEDDDVVDDDDDDEEDDEDQESEDGKQTGAQTLSSLKRYMDEMDQELQTTNIAQSFTHSVKQGGDITADSADPSDPTEEHLQPLDIDVNLVTNLLKSLSSQAGLAGPASNLLHSLGLHLPPNADS